MDPNKSFLSFSHTHIPLNKKSPDWKILLCVYQKKTPTTTNKIKCRRKEQTLLMDQLFLQLDDETKKKCHFNGALISFNLSPFILKQNNK